MDSVIDLLDLVEQIRKSIKLNDSEGASLDTFLKTLDGLGQDELEAISNVLLLMRQLCLPEGSVKKCAKQLWPSFTKALLDAPTPDEPRGQDAGGDLKWPSLVGQC